MESSKDKSEFMDLFVAEQALIYAFIRGMVPNTSDAEELFQQVAMTMWRKWDTFDPDVGAFRSWGLGIAKNHIRNFSRRQYRADRVQVFAPDVMDRISACWQDFKFEQDWQERDAALRECVSKLNTEDRHRLENHYYGGVKAQQAADDEGISLRTFYRKIDKIRRQLLDCIMKSMELDKLNTEGN